ncbi:MAG: hypothetical protein LBP53_06660 [Candidatus Peribacteria bacterium]|nr:hypothetical protein [Candidatus Peribacteria bacterium]
MEDISFTDSLPTGLELVSAEITSNQGGNVLISGNDLQFTISGCVNSQFFPTPSNSYCYGNASTATVIIKAKIKTPVNACQSSVITNTANYAVQKISSTHYNDDNSMTITSLSGGGSISFSAQPRKGDLEMNII